MSSVARCLSLIFMVYVITLVEAQPSPAFRYDFSPSSPHHMTMSDNGTGVIGPFDSQHPWTFWNQNKDKSYVMTDDFIQIDEWKSYSIHMVVYLEENHDTQLLMWAWDRWGEGSLATIEWTNLTSSLSSSHNLSRSFPYNRITDFTSSSLPDVDSAFTYAQGISAQNFVTPLPTQKWMSLLMVVDRTSNPTLPSLYYYLDGGIHAEDLNDIGITYHNPGQSQFCLMRDVRGAVSLFEVYNVALTGAQARNLAQQHVNDVQVLQDF